MVSNADVRSKSIRMAESPESVTNKRSLKVITRKRNLKQNM